MGNAREHLESGRGGSFHIGDFLQSGGAGDDFFWSGDVGAINRRGKLLSGGTYGILTTGDGEKEEEEFGRYLNTGGDIEHTEGGEETGGKEVHWQDTSVCGSLVGPPYHIRSMRATRDRLRGRGEDNTLVVVADGVRRRQTCNYGSRWKRFCQKQGSICDGNPEGVKGEGSI